MRPIGPVLTLDLMPQERMHLLELLGQLTNDERAAAAICPSWTVKDIALHVLGDDPGRLSGGRDDFTHDSPEIVADSERDSWKSLVEWLNRWNENWVRTTRRISSQLLIDLLEFTGRGIHRYFESLDQSSLRPPVSWAGPSPAPVWLDVPREYTERWGDQQQIRYATGRPGLNGQRFMAPVLSTFVRALPHTFRDMRKSTQVVQLVISGASGGNMVRPTRRQWLEPL